MARACAGLSIFYFPFPAGAVILQPQNKVLTGGGESLLRGAQWQALLLAEEWKMRMEKARRSPQISNPEILLRRWRMPASILALVGKLVPDTPDCEDHLRMLRVFLDLGTQSVNV